MDDDHRPVKRARRHDEHSLYREETQPWLLPLAPESAVESSMRPYHPQDLPATGAYDGTWFHDDDCFQSHLSGSISFGPSTLPQYASHHPSTHMNPAVPFDAQQLGEPVPRNSHSAELVSGSEGFATSYVLNTQECCQLSCNDQSTEHSELHLCYSSFERSESAIQDNNSPSLFPFAATESEELICFGMLTTLTAHVVDPLPLSRYKESEAPINLQGDRSLVFSDSGLNCGKIESRDSQLLQLLTNEGIEFDLLYLHRDHHLSPDSVSILATIYGPREKAKSLGVVLQSLDYYLQDPKFAARDLEYFNPHRFANTPDARATDFRTTIPLDESLTSEDEAVISVAILDTFTTQLSFPTQLVDPPYLLTQLKSHQKQALWFMVQRETGWNMGEHGKDVWSQQHDSHGQAIYVNNVDSSLHYSPPKPFRGGILADTMGLGKSLSMISLIAHGKYFNNGKENTTSGSGTLLVLPYSLLHNWEQELRKHLSDKDFVWRRHHARSRIKDFTVLKVHDIVLTTYSTLAKEWQSPDGNHQIFSHKWHRVILDEAHEIKDPKTAKSQAVFELRSHRRWAVTGTPLQNRVSDLFSLFQFLEVFPYCEKDTFKDHIISPWLRGEDAGHLALKKLLGYIMLRRSTGTIELPPRRDIRRMLSLSASEQQAYDLEKAKTIEYLDAALASAKPRDGYRNALEKVNALRLICELGCYRKENKFKTLAPQNGRARSRSAPGTPVGPLTPMTPTEEDEDNDTGLDTDLAWRLEQCFPSCSDSKRNGFLASSRGQPRTESIGTIPPHLLPTKVRALLVDLQQCKEGTKSVVFSYRSTILDVTAAALNDAGISWVQIDGRVGHRKRNSIIETFTSTTGTQVLLLSLGCGAVGLTLTAASRAYLLEPQWNPAIEEQALARIHRMGQKQEITTIRFVISNSIEKYVLDIQDGKRDLTALLLNAKTNTDGQVMGKLKELRQLLH